MSYKSQSDLYLEDNISKYPAIELLCKLGYEYISPEECMAQRGSLYHVLLRDVLRRQLSDMNEFEFDGIARTIWAGYNLIEPDKPTEQSI